MSKLCQIVAVEKSVKNKAHQGLTEAYQKVQKSALLTGISRVYRPNDESGEQLPAESTRVQLNAQDVLKDVAKVLTELFDVTACKDYTNCFAHADVSVGEVVLAKDVPITYLLFLEKKLTDIHTFVSKLPTLDPSEEWTFDSNVGAFVSKPSETVKTKKVFVPLLLSPATDKHPAQVKEGFEDKTVGVWKTVKFSGAMPAQKVADMLERVERLQKAVKFAREECNTREVEQVKVGEKIFTYLFT
jgi:hypothetical protein